MSTVEAPRRAPARKSQTRRAGEWLLWSHLYMAAWFWGVVLVLAVGTSALLSNDRFDQSGTSTIAFGVQAGMWFSFAMAIALSLRQLEAHVAAGMTRQSFLRANVAVASLMAVVYALVMVLLLWVESLVARAAGWEVRRVSQMMYDSVADLPGLFVVYLFVFLVGACAGLVVGMAYQRLGGVWGTVTLLPAIPPVFFAVDILSEDGGGWLPDVLDPNPVRMLLALVVAVGYVVVYRTQMRRVTI
jgi:hypothetical protein